jgi:hypothetical protein
VHQHAPEAAIDVAVEDGELVVAVTQPPVPLNQAVKGLKFTAAVEGAVMHGLERDLTKRCKTVDEFARGFCTSVQMDLPGKKPGFLASLFRKGGAGS